jgi:hypothetical protein
MSVNTYDNRETALVTKAIELLGEDQVVRDGTTIEWHDDEPVITRGNTMLSLGPDGRLYGRIARGNTVVYGLVTEGATFTPLDTGTLSDPNSN